jgi:predicted DNA-binding ribbon-helix-helix protein
LEKKQVTLRLSQQEYKILERIGRAYGITVTTLITRFIFNNLIYKTLEIPIQNLEKMLEEVQNE